MLLVTCVRKSGRASGPATAIDPYWSNVVLLWGANAAFGSPLTEESANGWDLTPIGNVQCDTTTFKFGPGSYLGDGVGDRVLVGENIAGAVTAFDFGTADFTIEAWVRSPGGGSPSVSRGIVSRGANTASNSSWYFYINAGGPGYLTFWCRGTFKVTTATETVTDDAWHHVAVCRNGLTTRLFRDGIEINSVIDGAPYDITPATSEWPNIGANPNNASATSWPGHIDEVRVTKGVARYTANFTPPAAAFPRG